YGYPTLPPLCPLAGAVAVAAARTRRTGLWLRGAAAVSALALAGAAVGLALAGRKLPHATPALLASAALALATMVLTLRHPPAGRSTRPRPLALPQRDDQLLSRVVRGYRRRVVPESAVKTADDIRLLTRLGVHIAGRSKRYAAPPSLITKWSRSVATARIRF